MSLTMVLVPMAVAVCVTSAETALTIREKYRTCQEKEALEIETRFADGTLLIQTLREHGAAVIVHDETLMEADFQAGRIVYYRDSSEEMFRMKIIGGVDMDGLICGLEELESAYLRNVQSYTYAHVMEHLPEGMTAVEEKVLEDDSILITIAID